MASIFAQTSANHTLPPPEPGTIKQITLFSREQGDKHWSEDIRRYFTGLGFQTRTFHNFNRRLESRGDELIFVRALYPVHADKMYVKHLTDQGMNVVVVVQQMPESAWHWLNVIKATDVIAYHPTTNNRLFERMIKVLARVEQQRRDLIRAKM